MSPETLIGMELGKGVLQRLLGQGTMGAVYLAYQPNRQVAVKVFLPASQLEQADHDEFKKRLGQVIAQGAFLDHEHVLGILDYGEQAGFTYQTMPYIAGESLQTLLARSGPLPFPYIQIYLEQLAKALDYAHTHGILHRDVKPENILLTPEGRLLLADFGLAGLTTEKAFARARRAAPGMLNYIAPEYVLNKPLDQRADLYSLGVVLYQMATGTVPFQSVSLTEVAMQHVKAIPPSPDSLRPDLPQAAAHVILRALAKSSAERYASARELASAFRQALLTTRQDPPAEKQAPNALDLLSDLAKGNTATRLAAPRGGGLFDPKWQNLAAASNNAQPNAEASAPAPAAPSAFPDNNLKRPGLLRPTHLQANALDELVAQPQNQAELSAQMPGSFVNQITQKQQPFIENSPRLTNQATDHTEQWRFSPRPSPQDFMSQSASSPRPNTSETTGMFKLNEAATIAQVPVENGRFGAGFLPISTNAKPSTQEETSRKRRNPGMKAVSLFLAVLVVAISSGIGIFWFTHQPTSSTSSQTRTTPNLNVSPNGRATATANANMILSDNLSQNNNNHNWTVGAHGSFNYAFMNGAYHITNHDKTSSAPALLANQVLNAPFAYSLTMEQLQGDLTSPNNQFGLLLNTTVKNINGKQVDTFYAFEVLNKPGGQYQFWKYDNSKDGANPWTLLWSKSFGKEFLQGSGPSHVNTLKVIDTGKNFVFVVNGTQVGTWKDSSFSSGSIGMLVNLNGAEVAFSHLLLTYA